MRIGGSLSRFHEVQSPKFNSCVSLFPVPFVWFAYFAVSSFPEETRYARACGKVNGILGFVTQGSSSDSQPWAEGWNTVGVLAAVFAFIAGKKFQTLADMDWRKWMDLFEHQYNVVCWNRLTLHKLMKLRDDHLNWGDTFGELEEKHGRKVHEAVLKFAKTEKWPKMSDEVVALLGERLMFALGFVEQLKWAAEELGMNAPYGEKTDEETIHWFLIDAWRHFGYNYLEGNLMQIPCVETTATRELKKKLWKDVTPIRPDQN